MIQDLYAPAPAPARAPSRARRPAPPLNRARKRRIVVMSRLAGLSAAEDEPAATIAPANFNTASPEGTLYPTFNATLSIADGEIRDRQILAGVNPVDSGWYALGTKQSLVGPNGSDSEYARLKPISDYYKALFQNGGLCGTPYPHLNASAACRAELARNIYGRYYPAGNMPAATTPVAIGSGYQPGGTPGGQTEAPQGYGLAPTETTNIPIPESVQDITVDRFGASAPPPVAADNLRQGPITINLQTPGGTPQIIGGPAAGFPQQLQQPVAALLPAPVAAALPSFLTALPIWQLGIAAAALAYTVMHKKGNKR